ncbi:histidine kinase [Chloroflexus islandicus]|uniref:histidine kinase n=1 Tax=Chloroflexus islandicus TaxID=1707952 RepID=A0A178M3N2_9CHLR|nr:ATP-binding protein [Chloroflexus islandicus]OAN42879.1 histidine kinase [Chloroflexus islandicus]
MLKPLRWQFTLLYALTAAAIIALVGSGAYVLVARYFERITDLALQHKMAHEFHSLNAPLPPSLAFADADWSVLRSDGPAAGRRMLTADEASRIALATRGGEIKDVKLETDKRRYEVKLRDGSEVKIDAYSGQIVEIEINGEHVNPPPVPISPPAAYEAELASIFVLPLDAQGRILFNPNPAALPMLAHQEALEAALRNGSDLRTITTSSGQQVRLLTYRLTRPDGPAALQLGRVLTDQTQVLNQLLTGLLGFGFIGAVIVGAAGWWLSGRALRPVEEAWARQLRFISSASHELRAPLTLIRASAEVALRNAEDEDQRELLADVLSESDHMRRLVDDLLTLSRLDSGALTLQRQPIQLSDFLADVQRHASRLGDEHGVTIALAKTEGTVCADPDRLRQILLILIDNAIRYTPASGTITLSAELAGKQVRIGVRDTGCGIAPEHLPHLFERFYRADQARNRANNNNNAGLGLSIAKGLVEAHGGTIGVESKVNAGTLAWFTIPAA